MVAFIQKELQGEYKGEQIQVGDEICSINGVDFTGATGENNVLAALKNSGNTVSLVLKRGKIPCILQHSIYEKLQIFNQYSILIY